MIVLMFFISRRLGGNNRLLFELLHSMSDLAEEQTAFHQSHGYYAAHVGLTRGDSTIALADSFGATLVITHADSLGWTATGFNPGITGGVRQCYVFGGRVEHDPTLLDPGVPRCW